MTKVAQGKKALPLALDEYQYDYLIMHLAHTLSTSA